VPALFTASTTIPSDKQFPRRTAFWQPSFVPPTSGYLVGSPIILSLILLESAITSKTALVM
jgi:hypothetical protein